MDIEAQLPDICDALQLPKFKPCESEFLKEYIMVMKPLAETLDILQGEKTCFFGMILPKLVQLQNRLNIIINQDLQHARPLAKAVKDGLATRYADMLSLGNGATNAIIASVSHPFYKLKWVPPEKREEISNLFIQVVQDSAVSQSNSISLEVDDYGYDFNNLSQDLNLSINNYMDNKVKLEVMSYLTDHSKEVESLNRFPLIKSAFIRFNTTLPSSAPVERLFSTAGLILLPNRNRLSDQLFEKLLIIKSNANLTQ
jgi:hypothetical protein